jgi:hypothetical protein
VEELLLLAVENTWGINEVIQIAIYTAEALVSKLGIFEDGTLIENSKRFGYGPNSVTIYSSRR